MFSALADYHMHTPLCRHAAGWPVEYARAAAALGLQEIGFSDHSPMPENFDDWRMGLDDLSRYLEVVAEARQAFPGLNIRLGLECDFLPGHEPWIEQLAGMAPWDYLIGSVHYLPNGFEVDHPKSIGRHEGNATEIWTVYWELYEQCIRSKLFDFVAHPDLPKKFGYRPEGDLRRFYEPSIKALQECGVAFEINTAGLRKPCRELYPATGFLEMAQTAGAGLLINSDAHAPGEVGAGFEEGVGAAKRAGFTHTLRFKGRQHTSVALP